MITQRRMDLVTGLFFGSAFLLLGGNVVSAADWTFHRCDDVAELKLYKTDRDGNDIGGPFLTTNYEGCDRSHKYDYGAVIRDYRADPPGGRGGMSSSIDSGFLGGDVGDIHHVEVESALQSLGRIRIRYPWIDPSTPGKIYVSVDIAEWATAGGEEDFEECDGTMIGIVDGSSPLLPGYVIGTAPLTLNASTGWVNPSPYNGNVEIVGEMMATAADVPTVSEWGLIVLTVLLLTAGTIVFGRRRRAVAA